MKVKNTSNLPKKIVCMVINDLTSDQRMHRICDTLIQSGFNVILIGRQLPNSAPLVERSFQQIRLKCYWNKGFLFYTEYNIRLMIWLLFHRFDIVNAIDLDTIIPAYIVGKIKNVKKVYDAHEWFPYCPEIIERPKVHQFWLKIESFFLPRMDSVYTVSQSIADELSSKYLRQIGLVRNMPFSKEPHPHSDEKYILYQGALNVGRGIAELIDAMKELDIPLYIAGRGDIEDQLKEKVNFLHLHHKVRFLGNLDPEQLWIYTENAYLGVNLLENKGLNYYYSLANKFFDYIQAEIPQITMNFPEYAHLNAQYEVAILIDNLNPSFIYEAIHTLLSDSKKYDNLKENTMKAKKLWNWENEKSNLLNIYEQL
ncbi:MAG: glycosyltransferase [Chitinophagales bacterium]|nr:glycosyltransferase [Chitinophagales bacterium]